jgi:hypothetical protein
LSRGDAGFLEDQVEGLRDGLDRDVRPFLHAAGQLDHAIHQETLLRVEHGRVVRAAAVVDADDDPILVHGCRSLCRIVSTGLPS